MIDRFKAILEEEFPTTTRRGYSDRTPISHFADGSHKLNRADVSVKCVASVGGEEGEGENAERIYEVTFTGEEPFFVLITGFYNSNYGTEWDNELTQVYPVTLTVTRYRAADQRATYGGAC